MPLYKSQDTPLKNHLYYYMLSTQAIPNGVNNKLIFSFHSKYNINTKLIANAKLFSLANWLHLQAPPGMTVCVYFAISDIHDQIIIKMECVYQTHLYTHASNIISRVSLKSW